MLPETRAIHDLEKGLPAEYWQMTEVDDFPSSTSEGHKGNAYGLSDPHAILLMEALAAECDCMLVW